MTAAPELPADAQPKASADVRLKPIAQAHAEAMPVGHLLAWADQHEDSDIRDQSARARAALAGLRQRHAADQELTAITTEAEQLEKRLAELRSREAELTPAKPKRARKPAEYPAAEVRAWAKENGLDCPPVGRVPKAVVEAWRESLPQAG
ncbi:Lsr2 family DNA-binding protein [Streptomyces sediminimaris]